MRRPLTAALALTLGLWAAAPAASAAGGPEELRRRGYRVYPVKRLQTLNTCGRDPNGPWRATLAPSDLIVSGSFTASCQEAVGAYMSGGRLVSAGYGKTAARGGVAVLSDGSAVVCRPGANTAAAIQQRCGRPGKPVMEFMGGGALLVWPGATDAAANQDLCRVQHFDQGSCGLGASQMRKTWHTVVAMHGDTTYVALPSNKSAAEIRYDLRMAGFTWGVKLDGGRGFYYRERTGGSYLYPGACNCLGLRVQTR